MKKKLMIAIAAMTLALSWSITVCAQPEVMPDGTVFDAEYYAQSNPDVAAVFGTDVGMLYHHYIQFGKAEGRLAADPAAELSDEEFDAEYYARSNPDVVAALGTDPIVLYQHYIQCGKAEGRKAVADSQTSGALSEKNVYAALISMKNEYPQGMTWTNDNFYQKKGSYKTWGMYSGGYGCAGFAYLLSDTAFGELPYRMHTDFSNIRVGDVIRLNNDTHSVIVLEVRSNSVIVAEGNYNKQINWGREISLQTIYNTGTYLETRYPQ